MWQNLCRTLITGAVCDCFCSTLKDADKYQTEYWDFIETYFTSNKEYEARFAAVMLLGHFVKREYLKESIRRLESITQQGYYAKMAVAWAVSVYFAAFPDEMLDILAGAVTNWMNLHIRNHYRRSQSLIVLIRK